MIYEILNDAGEVINTIIASQEFVDAEYPGHYRLVGPEPAPLTPDRKSTRLNSSHNTRWP